MWLVWLIFRCAIATGHRKTKAQCWKRRWKRWVAFFLSFSGGRLGEECNSAIIQYIPLMHVHRPFSPLCGRSSHHNNEPQQQTTTTNNNKQQQTTTNHNKPQQTTTNNNKQTNRWRMPSVPQKQEFNRSESLWRSWKNEAWCWCSWTSVVVVVVASGRMAERKKCGSRCWLGNNPVKWKLVCLVNMCTTRPTTFQMGAVPLFWCSKSVRVWYVKSVLMLHVVGGTVCVTRVVTRGVTSRPDPTMKR